MAAPRAAHVDWSQTFLVAVLLEQQDLVMCLKHEEMKVMEEQNFACLPDVVPAGD